MRWAVAIVAAIVLAAAGTAAAGGFGLSPLGVTLSPRESSAAISVENTGDGPLVVQVRTLKWTQRDGKDVREDTRDLIVNPPIFKLAPGEQQLVRFASRVPPPLDAERAYRAIFTEVLSRDGVQQEGLRIALAMDVPVYVEPPSGARPAALQYLATRGANGIRLRIANPGQVHVRLSDVEVAVGGAQAVRLGAVAVLANEHLDFQLPPPAAGATAIQLTASDGDQKIALDLPLAP